MENTIRFPQTTDIQINHYSIYKDIKAVESIILDRDYTYLAILCAQGVVHIYDNITKLKLGKIEFLEILRESPLFSTFESSVKSLAEKDKLKIIDTLSFSRNPNVIGLSSSKLSALFLIKTNFLNLSSEEQRPTLHDVYHLDKKNIVSKESPLGFIMDPYSEYSFLAFSQSVILSNFLKKTDFKINLEIESDISMKKEPQEDRIIVASYLERFSSKSLKRIICCVQDQICMYEVQFGDPKNQKMNMEGKDHNEGSDEYFNLVKLANFFTGAHLKTNYIALSHTNQYLAVKYSKKTAKIFVLDVSNKSIKDHSEFEASEGKTYQDIFFNVYDNQDDVHEDWAILLEKNAHGFGFIFSQLNNTSEKKTHPRAILDSNLRLKKSLANIPWRNAIMGITDHGTLSVLELKMPPSWINYAYKFTYTNENIEYVEREDEFDVQEDDTKIEQSKLDTHYFDDLPEGAVIKTVKREPFKFSELQVKKEEFISSDESDDLEVKEEDGAIEPEENEPQLIVKERLEEEVSE